MLYFPCVFCIFAPGTWRSLDFPDFLILRYVEAFSEGLRIVGVYFLSFSFILLRSIVVYLKSGSRLTFFLIFLHFLQKYRCVPKIGFSADIFIVNSIGIFICISIDIFIVIFIDIYIDTLTFIDKEVEEEGVDFFLKSNNPTPKGGEQELHPCIETLNSRNLGLI